MIGTPAAGAARAVQLAARATQQTGRPGRVLRRVGQAFRRLAQLARRHRFAGSVPVDRAGDTGGTITANGLRRAVRQGGTGALIGSRPGRLPA